MADTNVQKMVAESDTGGRAPHGAFSRNLLFILPLVWALFQLWIASPLPFELGIGVWNDTQTRAIHLAFAVFLAFVAFPTLKSSPRHYIPLQDWAFGLIAAACAAYISVFYSALAERSGAPNTTDIVLAVIGIAFLMEAARRSLGLPLMLVAAFFLSYVFFGSWDGLPDVVRWKGASIEKAMSHMWLTTEGVFGVALGVSSGFVFLFVLYGALLNQAGAGNYFLKLAFAALGHLSGGPAKAAVVASAATGLISGSSIANVVTTGTFTIPLMKKVGFTPAKAGAVEVSSSINGVLTPPVMGAVAFLMTEYVGISYVEVVKTAIVPAAISYIALVYIVHLEALKSGMRGTSKAHPLVVMLSASTAILSGIIIGGVVLWLTGVVADTLKDLLGPAASYILIAMLLIIYVAAVWWAAQRPDLSQSMESMEDLPRAGEIFKTGAHYILPILVLMYLLMVERQSAGQSAFWSTVFMLFILLTQNPLKQFFRGQDTIKLAFQQGIGDIMTGMVTGARNMIGLACAMGVAGIIVGAVTLTGVGQVMAEFVEFLSGGHLLLMLIFVAIISIILGMGLPTTANYIVVSSLMASVVVELGQQNGLIVPLVAVHMFVFYFGIMADVTPPVGLASFAAAAISGADPMRTGFTAFFYSIRTALLPFLFIFNTDLLLINVGWLQAIFVFFFALVAMLIFAAGTMGYFLTKSRLWESLALVLIALVLFRPGFLLDRVSPPYQDIAPTQIIEIAENAPDNASIRLAIEGETLDGTYLSSIFMLPLGLAGRDGETRLSESAGLEVIPSEDGKNMIVDSLTFAGAAEKQGIDFDWTITKIEQPADRMPKEIFYIPALSLFLLIAFLQYRRKNAP